MINNSPHLCTIQALVSNLSDDHLRNYEPYNKWQKSYYSSVGVDADKVVVSSLQTACFASFNNMFMFEL